MDTTAPLSHNNHIFAVSNKTITNYFINNYHASFARNVEKQACMVSKAVNIYAIGLWCVQLQSIRGPARCLHTIKLKVHTANKVLKY